MGYIQHSRYSCNTYYTLYSRQYGFAGSAGLLQYTAVWPAVFYVWVYTQLYAVCTG